MPEPNSEHIHSTPNVPGNSYQTGDMGPVEGWAKAYPGAHPGAGWRHVHDIPDADSGAWHQA